MNIAFYNGASGLVAHQSALDQVANNIANVNTTGYKPTRPEFEDLLYTQMYTNEEKPMHGHGVKLSSADLLYGQGPIQQTYRALDFALMTDGFFAVQDLDGETVYTRNGAFDLSIEGKNAYLVDDQGRYVLDSRGSQITVNKLSDDTYDYSGLTDKIGVFVFDNPYGLESINNTSFRESDNSGTARVAQEYLIREQALENSGVQLADEMTNLIVTQRAYQLSARVVQTSDEMEEIVNNLR